jgi:hypothetical protein
MPSLLDTGWKFTMPDGSYPMFTVQFSANGVASVASAGYTAQGTWSESPRQVAFMLTFQTPDGAYWEIAGLHKNGQGSGSIIIDTGVGTPQTLTFTMAVSLLNTTWTVTFPNRDFAPYTIQFGANGTAIVTYFYWRLGVRSATWTENQNTFSFSYYADSPTTVIGQYQGNQGSGTVHFVVRHTRAYTLLFNMAKGVHPPPWYRPGA